MSSTLCDAGASGETSVTFCRLMTSNEQTTVSSSDKDEDALLAMLIPDAAHATALTRQECQEYLRRLTSLPMDRLASEPATLEAESAKIKGLLCL